MAKSYADYKKVVGQLLKDKSLISDEDDILTALDNAADTLARYRLNVKVKEYTSNGGRLYELPTDWDNDRGKFDVEYPVSDTAGQVQYLDIEMNEIYATPDGFRLRFRDKDGVSGYVPPDGEKFRLHYGVPYRLGNDDITVPDSLFVAVCKLGAREVCLILNGRMLQMGNMVTGGGFADFGGQGNNLLILAKEFMRDFLNRVAPEKSDRPGKVIFGSFESTPLHKFANTLWPRDNSLRSYANR